MKDQLTVIIPVKDREQFLIRWMYYAKKVSFPFKLFIADGSANNEMQNLFLNNNNFSSINYEYVKFPHDKSYDLFWNKLLKSLKEIKTPYVAIGNDDDLYCVDGLLKSVEFLNRNSDYSICGGKIGVFEPLPSKKYSDYKGLYSNNIYCSFNDTSQSIRDNSSLDRIKSHFSNYALTFYDVQHKEQAVFAYQKIVDLKIENILLVELVTSFISIAQGKSKRLNDIFLMRQATPESSFAKTYTEQKGDEFDQMLYRSWSIDLNNFFDEVANIVVQKDNIDLENSIKQIKKSYREYISTTIVNNLSRDYVKNKNFFLMNNKVKLLIRKIDHNNLIKKYYSKFNNSLKYRYKKQSDISDVIKFLSEIPISKS